MGPEALSDLIWAAYDETVTALAPESRTARDDMLATVRVAVTSTVAYIEATS